MAMCFGLVALGGVPVRINDPKCVAKTFPDYFECSGMASRAMNANLHPGHRHRRPLRFRQGHGGALVAKELGFHYLDSGAIYRVTALAAQYAGIALDDEAALAELAGKLDVRFDDGEIWLDGEKVGDAVRTEESGNAASKIAALPQLAPGFAGIPAQLSARRRAWSRTAATWARWYFPTPTLKIFLTASAEVRAERRYKQLMEKGMHANLSRILQDLQQRDARDSARSVAPLQKCADASLLDTDALTIAAAVNEVLRSLSGTTSARRLELRFCETLKRRVYRLPAGKNAPFIFFRNIEDSDI